MDCSNIIFMFNLFLVDVCLVDWLVYFLVTMNVLSMQTTSCMLPFPYNFAAQVCGSTKSSCSTNMKIMIAYYFLIQLFKNSINTFIDAQNFPSIHIP